MIETRSYQAYRFLSVSFGLVSWYVPNRFRHDPIGPIGSCLFLSGSYLAFLMRAKNKKNRAGEAVSGTHYCASSRLAS